MKSSKIKPKKSAQQHANQKVLKVAVIVVAVIVVLSILFLLPKKQFAGKATGIPLYGPFLEVGTAGVPFVESYWDPFTGKNISEITDKDTFGVPVTINIGEHKSVAYRFKLKYPKDLLSIYYLNCNDYNALTPNLSTNPYMIINHGSCDNSKGELIVERAWLCNEDCSNAITQSKGFFGMGGFSNLSALEAVMFDVKNLPEDQEEVTAKLEFEEFTVLDLETNENLIKEIKNAEIKIVKGKEGVPSGCSKTNAELCLNKKDCFKEKLLWDPGELKCYSSCPSEKAQIEYLGVCRTPAYECNDSDVALANDNGADLQTKYYVNYQVKGTATGTALWSDNTEETDNCWNTTHIMEKYCFVVYNSYKYIGGTMEQCPSGTICEAGKCAKEKLLVASPITIQLIPKSGNIGELMTSLQAGSLSANNEYLVNVTINPNVALPADHLVLVLANYNGSIQKTQNFGTYPALEIGKAESSLFNTLITASSGSVTFEVLVWSSLPSPDETFTPLMDKAAVTYVVK